MKYFLSDLGFYIRKPYWDFYYKYKNPRRHFDKWKKSHDIDDLRKYIIESNDVDIDIEEIVHWNRSYIYRYSINGISSESHTHSLKELFLQLLYIYIEDPNFEVEFDDRYFHKDELLMVKRFVDVLKEEYNSDLWVQPNIGYDGGDENGI